MSRPVIQIFRDGKDNPGLQKYLKQVGFEVVVSASLDEGLNLFQKVRSDIAIIDYYGAPEGKSLEVAKLLQQQRQPTPVILIVRESSEAKAIAALRVGVNDYFKSPFYPRNCWKASGATSGALQGPPPRGNQRKLGLTLPSSERPQASLKSKNISPGLPPPTAMCSLPGRRAPARRK